MKKSRLLILKMLLALMCIGWSSETWAQNWNQIIKTCASDRAAGDSYGNSVSISGDYAVVGAINEDHDATGANTLTDAGAAYILKKINGTWTQVKKICASDRAANDQFGASVYISGDYVIVGARAEDEDALGANTLNMAGSAYIFNRNQGGADMWGQVKKIVASDRAMGNWFGWSVSISGDYAIVAAYRESEDAAGANTKSDAGAAYIFSRNQGGTDNWGQLKKICASDRAATAYFGTSVSISGDYAIVGAYRETKDAAGASPIVDAGAAYIFSRNQGGADMWGQLKKIVATDRGYSSSFGCSVSISGDYAIVGASNDDRDAASANPMNNSGAAYIFSRNQGGANMWGQVKKICASDRATDDNFGFSVSISGDYAIVSAIAEDEDAAGANTKSGAGSAYIFSRNQGGANIWGQVKKIVASDRAANDLFGYTVSISGDYAIVGTYVESEDAAGANTLGYAGSAYFYYMNTVWNGTAWDHTVPNSTIDAVINGDYTVSTSINCKNLTINSGKSLQIQPGVYVNVAGNLVNNGTLLLNSPANLSTSGQLLTQGSITNNGVMNATRYLVPEQWHFISSPLNAPVLAINPFSDLIAYTYKEAATTQNDAWVTVYGNSQVNPKIGYLVKSPSTRANSLVTFSGTFFTGNANINNLRFSNINAANKGYNLIANPYPSAIDWNAAAGWTKTNIAPTIFVWNNSVYATWNGTVGVNGGSRYIAPMQAFIVQATAATNSIAMTNSVRVTNTQAFKKDEISNIIRLQTAGNNLSDETVLYFSENNTDSKKLMSFVGEVPQIFSIENNENISINELQNEIEEQSIELGFTCSLSGQYTITATELNLSSTNAVLEDKVTGIFTNLTNNASYSFAYTAGENTNRFILHFNLNVTEIDKLQIDKQLNIYSCGKIIYIQNPMKENGTVSIYSIEGKHLLVSEIKDQISTNLPSGMYMLKVQTNKNTISKKVILTN